MGIEPSLNVLELLEAGLDRYRTSAAGDLWRYYASSLPFAALLVGSLDQALATRVAHAALLGWGLAATYALRVWGAGSFSRRLLGSSAALPLAGAGRDAAAKRLWTHTALLLLWLLTLPLGLASTLVYTATRHAAMASEASIGRALRLAARWWGQQWLLLALMLLFGAILFLNLAVAGLALLWIWHAAMGSGAVASSAGGGLALLFEPGYWLGLLALVYLLLDPWARAAAAVAQERLEARRTGADLVARIAQLERPKHAWQRAASMLLLVAALAGAAPKASAQTPVDPGRMHEAIRAELRQPAYRWHSDQPTPLGIWLDHAMGWLFRPLRTLWGAISAPVERLLRWIGAWLSGGSGPKLQSTAAGHGLRRTAWIVVGISLLLAALLLAAVRRRRQSIEPDGDVSDRLAEEPAEAAAASQEQWLETAQRLQAAGEWRLAFRAAFLAGLAYLGQRQWVQLRADRTNREYRLELARRARLLPDSDPRRRTLERDFEASARGFDAVWYGGQGVNADRLDDYLQAQRAWVGQ
ncbi:MAG: hypothetical protein ACRD1E_04395 [Terriglobales bacterium]